MVNDLLRSGRLAGNDKPAVRAMLGQPTREHDYHWYYQVDIGHRFGSSPWYYHLRVEFDGRTAKVKSAELLD